MISEFIWLDITEQTKDVLRCSCSLPDPDLDDDERMIVCGDVECRYKGNGEDEIVTIELFNNFRELCIGDSYQRKEFAQRIILILNIRFGINIKNPDIKFLDCWGNYFGKLDFLDEVIR